MLGPILQSSFGDTPAISSKVRNSEYYFHQGLCVINQLVPLTQLQLLRVAQMIMHKYMNKNYLQQMESNHSTVQAVNYPNHHAGFGSPISSTGLHGKSSRIAPNILSVYHSVPACHG